jgi:hypothetical protein
MHIQRSKAAQQGRKRGVYCPHNIMDFMQTRTTTLTKRSLTIALISVLLGALSIALIATPASAQKNIQSTTVEIGNDSIDNDGDGKIDEVNTGQHPTYNTYDEDSISVAEQYISKVVGLNRGRIDVTYTDGSVFRYTPHKESAASQKTLVQQFQDTGNILSLRGNGKYLRLTNGFTGKSQDLAILDLSKRNGYAHHYMTQADLRADESTEVIVVSRNHRHIVHVSVVRVDMANDDLKVLSRYVVTDSKVAAKKTSVDGSAATITLKDRKGATVKTLAVDENYKLYVK